MFENWSLELGIFIGLMESQHKLLYNIFVHFSLLHVEELLQKITELLEALNMGKDSL